MKNLTLLLLSMLLVVNSYTQEQNPYQNLSTNADDYDFRSQVDMGVGLGLNYGGFMGAQVQYVALDYLGIFGSAGYYLVGFGWQFGLTGYIMPKLPSKPFRVYGTLMYGTNAAIVVDNSSNYNNIYLGPTIGAGLEMRFGKSKRNGLNIDLFVPIRSEEYQSDLNNVKNNPSITDIQEPLPVTISVGYHFEIK